MFSWWALPVLPDQPVLHPSPFAVAPAAMTDALTCHNCDTNSRKCCFIDARMQDLVYVLLYQCAHARLGTRVTVLESADSLLDQHHQGRQKSSTASCTHIILAANLALTLCLTLCSIIP